MIELTKFQQLKMYLPVNGYKTLKDLADDWGVTERAIRDFCKGNFTSAKLDKLTNQFISDGDRKLKEHRKKKATDSTTTSPAKV